MLISQLSPSIESKSVFVSERGLTSVQWTEYSEHTKRVQYSTVPTSAITAKAVTLDGVALVRKDTSPGMHIISLHVICYREPEQCLSDNVKLSIGAYSNCRGSSMTEKLETEVKKL